MNSVTKIVRFADNKKEEDNDAMKEGRRIHSILEQRETYTVYVDYDTNIEYEIKALNLYVKLDHLFNSGEDYVREVQLTGNITGIIDGLRLIRCGDSISGIIVEETKTHVKKDGWLYYKKAYEDQVMLYGYILRELLFCLDIPTMAKYTGIPQRYLNSVVTLDIIKNLKGKTINYVMQQMVVWLKPLQDEIFRRGAEKVITCEIQHINQEDFRLYNHPSEIEISVETLSYNHEKVVDILLQKNVPVKKDKKDIYRQICARNAVRKKLRDQNDRKGEEKNGENTKTKSGYTFKEMGEETQTGETREDEREEEEEQEKDLKNMWSFTYKRIQTPRQSKKNMKQLGSKVTMFLSYIINMATYTKNIVLNLVSLSPNNLFTLSPTKDLLITLHTVLLNLNGSLCEYIIYFLDQITSSDVSIDLSSSILASVARLEIMAAITCIQRLCRGISMLITNFDNCYDHSGRGFSLDIQLVYLALVCIPEHDLYHGAGTNVTNPVDMLYAIQKDSVNDIMRRILPLRPLDMFSVSSGNVQLRRIRSAKKLSSVPVSCMYIHYHDIANIKLNYIHRMMSYPVIPPNMFIQSEVTLTRSENLAYRFPLSSPGMNNRLRVRNSSDSRVCLRCLLGFKRTGFLDSKEHNRFERCLCVNGFEDGTIPVTPISSMSTIRATQILRILIGTHMGRRAIANLNDIKLSQNEVETGCECRYHELLFRKHLFHFTSYLKAPLGSQTKVRKDVVDEALEKEYGTSKINVA